MKRKIFSILFVLVLVLSFSLVTAVPAQANGPYDDTYVDDDAGYSDTDGDADFATIQAAINNTNPGGTVHVADGTYNENIVVNKSLTLQADSSPVIDGGGNLGPGVHITAADVTFQGFTVTNFTCTPASGIGAMLVEGDGAVIDDNIIYDILPQGDPIDFPAGIGIDVHASNVEVTNNVVHDVGSIGIRVRYDWDTAPTVSNNVLLENNEVYRTANTGVLVTGYAKGVTIKNNEIYESLEPTPYSLFVHYGAEDVVICNNYIHDSLYSNVVIAGANNVTISCNTIAGAPTWSSPGKNIYILNDYGSWTGDDTLSSTNINIINNDIQNGGYGVRILYTVGGDGSQMATTTTIMFNNISGHTEYGVENNIATDVDATHNWWDDTSGPGGVGPGTGDAVSAYVDYSSWLGAPVVVPSLCCQTLDGTGPHEVDATAEADTEATLSLVSSTTDIYIVEYESQPFPEEPFPDASLGKFIDVYLSDPGEVVWPIFVEVHYTDGEVRAAGIKEHSLGLYYYVSPDAFHRCSDTGVDTAENIIWANMTEGEAVGSPVGGGGSPPIVGGTVLPVDKVSIVMPWIGLAVALALAGVFIARLARRKVRS